MSKVIVNVPQYPIDMRLHALIIANLEMCRGPFGLFHPFYVIIKQFEYPLIRCVRPDRNLIYEKGYCPTLGKDCERESENSSPERRDPGTRRSTVDRILN